MRNKRVSAVHAVLTVLLLLLLYVVQVSLLLRVGSEVLDLLPPFAIAAGSVLGPGTGMVCGLLAGALYDVSGSGVEGLYPLYFMIWGIASGYLCERHPRARLRVSMVCTAAMVGIIPALRYLFYYQFVADALFSAFVTNTVTRIVVAVVLCPVFIGVLRLLGRLCRRRPGRKLRRAQESLPEPIELTPEAFAADRELFEPDTEPEESASAAPDAMDSTDGLDMPDSTEALDAAENAEASEPPDEQEAKEHLEPDNAPGQSDDENDN